MIRVPLDQIQENPFQSRLTYDHIEELAESIRAMALIRADTSGLLQVPPARIVLTTGPDDPSPRILDPKHYERGASECLAEPGAVVQLAAGHRRWRAFRHLRDQGHQEYATFPVEIEVFDNVAMADIARAENAQRDDLSPIEEALSFQRVIDRLGWTQTQVGERWGLSQSAVANKIRLLQLPSFVRDLVHEDALPERTARETLPLLQIPGFKLSMVELRHRIRGDFRTAGEMNEHVRDIIKAQCRDLQSAPWEPRDEWVPDPADGDVVGPCGDCPHRVTILRRPRCTRIKCYDAKELAYQRQVAGPVKAAELYAQNQDALWQAVAKAQSWRRCNACDGSPNDPAVGTQGWVEAKMPDTSYIRHRICGNCWQRANLPEPPPVPEQAEAPGTVTTAGTAATPATPTRPAPVMRETEPPSPPPPPADLLTVRILPGEDVQGDVLARDALAQRRVLAAIGPEGAGPSDGHTRAGTYADLPLLVTELLAAYFPGNTGSPSLPADHNPPAGEEDESATILMEV